MEPTMRPDLRAILERDENTASLVEVVAVFNDPADQPQCVETLYRSHEGRYFLLVDRDLIAVTLATVFLWLETRGMPELTVWVGLELEKLEVEAVTREGL